MSYKLMVICDDFQNVCVSAETHSPGSFSQMKCISRTVWDKWSFCR